MRDYVLGKLGKLVFLGFSGLFDSFHRFTHNNKFALLGDISSLR